MLAHVDAGKTTLSEALLYKAGAVRKLGRVDAKDAFLDTHALEKERGITIFLKQAELELGGKSVTLIDTPGHVDFSSEAERTVAVLDYAVLVISAPEGVTAHTVTLWNLLKRQRTPVFVFVNKLDLPSPSREEILRSLNERLSEGFVDFTREDREESTAVLRESLTNEFLETGSLSDESLIGAVRSRAVFPVYFGSALRLNGIDALMDGLSRFTKSPAYPEDFAARVFKISYSGGQRLSLMKITGGRLKSKQFVSNRAASVPEDEVFSEKTDRILLYSGAGFTQLPFAEAGQVVAVTGLTRTRAGEGLGLDAGRIRPMLAPVLSYALVFPEGVNLFDAYRRIAPLSEEDPQLGIVWDEDTGEIRAELMGEVQCEVLSRLVRERFGLELGFGPARILYKETIADPVNGVGHFEPLRHFAHVETELLPLPEGSGIQIESGADPRELSPSWQRQILSALSSKRHRGVLTGSPLTDVRIVLTGGMAHLKHTEGGDFRKAASRAVRQALMKARSVLLEPYYRFNITLPTECVGRAMTDIRAMCGEFSAPEAEGDVMILSGCAPVATMNDYAKTLAAYTKGRGTLSLVPAEYRPCHNAEEVIARFAYDPEKDLRNTPDSVFCAAGAGFTVKWYEVEAYLKRFSSTPDAKMPTKKPVVRNTDEELMAIFERTYGRIEGTKLQPRRPETAPTDDTAQERGDEYLLVDGYNVIFAWDSLASIARDSIDLARETLIRTLINFSAGRSGTTILVFDAYKVTGGVERVDKEGGVYVVYTRESEIADVFIERAVEKLEGTKRTVRVVTSDGMEQLIVLGRGALRVPSAAFEKEVGLSEERMKGILERINRERAVGKIQIRNAEFGMRN